MTAVLIAATLFLAYANGANDNFKGVATLYGSGTASYRRALGYATLAALAGSLAAVLLGGGLVATFGGKGLVPDSLARAPSFASAVALGAALTVVLATVLGLPVSTTHALTGALVGAGLAAGGGVDATKLGSAFLLPLLVSPAAALLVAVALYGALRYARRRLGITRTSCLCVGPARAMVPVPAAIFAPPHGARLAVTADMLPLLPIAVTVGDEAMCVNQYAGSLLGLSVQRAVDALHLVSAGAVCFARALNDTPKLVGLLVLSGAVATQSGLLLAGAAIAVGGLLHARRVAETMSKKAVPLDAGSGFTANVVTSALVLAASAASLPVSTTHVSVGGILGMGLANRNTRWRVVGPILLAWVTTLPLGALAAALAYKILS